ncbi:MAG: response regulator [Sphingobacteriales bacterium]|nr:MAG: response regulator [Sphingobacteriales bacterium]
MPKRIHILEDDPDISYIIEYLLKDEGFELQVSSTFAELKQKIKDGLPDLFILDVMLPDGNGVEICEDLKTDMFTKHIPVIMMSASSVNKEMSEQVFADDYIAKPFDVDFVVSRINKILNK